MVDKVGTEALKQTLVRRQYGSADSTPARLSHPLPPLVAPQLIALFAIVSLLLVLAFNNVPALIALFPERDLYVSRYEGGAAIPLRLFIISFYVAFACFIDARWGVRGRFALDLIAPFFLLCVTLDLCNAVAKDFLGIAIPLLAIGLASGLAGMLIFALVLLASADMPPRSDSPLRLRFKIRSALTLAGVALLAAAIAFWVDSHDVLIVRELRDLALLGGVSVGVFLFIPLVYFLLNILAAIQNLFRARPSFSPDLTLVLPAHNEAHVIESTIAALDVAAGQYRGNVTLVVVDNASSDLTQTVAQRAFAKATNTRCVLLEEPRPGKAFALNRGLEAVETEFFARLDADTFLEPDTLTEALSHLGRKHVGAVGGLALPPGGGPFDGVREIEILLKLGYDQVAFGAADCILGIPGMFVAYRTEPVRRCGGFAHGINGEDTDMALRIGEDGNRLIIHPSVVFVSEVPRTLAHLREQRHRWFRSVYHVAARNWQLMDFSTFSVRGQVIIPFTLVNSARRAMAVPLLLFAFNFLIINPDPKSTIRTASVLALLLGAPTLNAVIAIVVSLRFKALLALPRYIAFRVLRSYLTLEALLTMNYAAYTARISSETARSALDQADLHAALEGSNTP